MKWSKIKAAVEDRLALSLKGRLQFYCTRYGPGVSSYINRAWVTLDGRQIVQVRTSEWWPLYMTYAQNIRSSLQCHRLEGAEREACYKRSYEDAIAALQRVGCYSRDDFVDSLALYLDHSIDAALHSRNSIVRAVAMVDQRLGKRRLVTIEESSIAHPLVKQFYELRREAEGFGVVPAPHQTGG
jgi:hypothetical protein